MLQKEADTAFNTLFSETHVLLLFHIGLQWLPRDQACCQKREVGTEFHSHEWMLGR